VRERPKVGRAHRNSSGPRPTRQFNGLTSSSPGARSARSRPWACIVGKRTAGARASTPLGKTAERRRPRTDTWDPRTGAERRELGHQNPPVALRTADLAPSVFDALEPPRRWGRCAGAFRGSRLGERHTHSATASSESVRARPNVGRARCGSRGPAPGKTSDASLASKAPTRRRPSRDSRSQPRSVRVNHARVRARRRGVMPDSGRPLHAGGAHVSA
jgi:hypothetical protein